MTESQAVLVRATGIPLQEREPEQITAALAAAGVEPDDQKPFLDLFTYARTNHLGISKLAAQTGISQTTLSQCYNGSYEGGNYVQIGDRIKTFFWRLEQKALFGGLREFVETRVTKVLWSVFEKVRVIRRIQIIQSEEQLGKTRSATEYTARNNSGRTVYVQLGGGSRSGCGDFIWGLADKLGIPYTLKMREKRSRIKATLESCDLVIIDEAHLIFSWALSAQREFWDYLRTDVFDNGARGVCLIATNCEVMDQLRQFRGAGRYNLGQLLGRMRNDPVMIEPVEDIVEDDIELLVARYYKTGKPGKRILALLTDVVRRPGLGHIGLLEDIMNEAWSKAKRRKKDLDDETVKEIVDETLTVLKAQKDLYTRGLGGAHIPT